jgi:transposase, IS30 family
MGQVHLSRPGRKNKHLTYRERLRIEVMLKEKKGALEISKAIGCSRRTIEREKHRGKVTQFNGVHWIYYEIYSADAGQNCYERNGQGKGPALKIGHDHELCTYLENEIIRRRRSPDAVLGRIKAEGRVFETSLCTRTLYRYIDQGVFRELCNEHLIYGKRKKGTGTARARPSYQNIRGRSIEDRSAAVNEREEAGHWEMDCVVSGKDGSNAVLLTLTERQTKKERIIKLNQKTQESVIAALDVLERQMGRKQFANTFRSITVDNGSEFLDYIGLERSIQSRKKPRTLIYYAHPYSSWERGTNENMNRMIRRFIPKGTDISKLELQAIKRIENWLNDYPRKILNYRTPAEAFSMVM